MAGLLLGALRNYKQYVVGYMDHRSDNFLLMQNIWSLVAVEAMYLYFVMNLGPRLMKGRKPFNLDLVLKIYNVVQVVCCALLLYKIIQLWCWVRFSLFCEPVNYSNSPQSLETLRLVWWYCMLKVFDLLDTVFIILRKKHQQVTFLHVYHHAGILCLSWLSCKYVPGGHTGLVGPLNCFVHMIMYSYYFVTNTWPQYKQHIWWKKYITQLQMLQVFILAGHSSVVVLSGPSCLYPKLPAAVLFIQNTVMFVFFADFYYKAYIKKGS